jgi:outer membrane protein assembly factor BamB
MLAMATVAVSVSAEDWKEWRGRDRLAVWHETGIVEELPDELLVKWRTPIGAGYSGPAVADGRVFTSDWVKDPSTRTLDGKERAIALDESTGEVLWTHEWRTSYRMLQVSYAIGPRATPTVDGDRVYIVGATGRLFCFDVATGEVIWEKDYVAEYDTSVPVWGIVTSPLVDGDRVITVIGSEPDGLVAAFDKRTGEELWRAIDVSAEIGYAQPVIYEAGGVRQLIVWHPQALSSLGPGDRRDLLATPLGGLHGRDCCDARPERRLSARLAVLQRLADDAAESGSGGGDGVVARKEPERASG